LLATALRLSIQGYHNKKSVFHNLAFFAVVETELELTAGV
jgi:hypothetical protein